MTYQVFARKYRPQSFDEVLGQEAIVRTLKNAIELKRLHHAYLFCGARGVGKTSLARIFAKSLNCEKGPTLSPCQVCTSCQNITKGISLDVYEIDGASNNGIDNIRELRDQARYLPTEGTYKIYIIDEVHMLSESAVNGLLKTMEEPPPHLIFIMATTEPHDIPATILSRCQRFDCTRFTVPQLETHLKRILDQENVALPADSIKLVAQSADGSVRDALSLLDQVVGFCGADASAQKVGELLGYSDRALIYEAFEAIINGHLNDALKVIKTLYEKGGDLKNFGESLLSFMRDALVFCEGGETYVESSPSELEQIKKLAGLTHSEHILMLFQILTRTVEDLSRSEFPQLIFEVGLVKLIHAKQYLSIPQILDQLEAMPAGPAPIVPKPASQAAYRPAPPAVQRPVANPSKMAFEPAYASPVIKTVIAEKMISGEPAAPRAAGGDWLSFVTHIKESKPQLGSLVEQAHPLVFGSKQVVLGFEKGSIHLEMIRDRVDALKHFLELWFGHAVSVELKFLSVQDQAPPTAMNMREENEKTHKENLRNVVLQDPAVIKTQEILGATLVDVRELK